MIDEMKLDPLARATICALSMDAIERARLGQTGTAMGMAPGEVSLGEGDQTYQDTVRPPEAKADGAIEEGASLGWAEWVGRHGAGMGMKGLGAPAAGKELGHKFGFTVEGVGAAARVRVWVGRNGLAGMGRACA